MPKMQQQSFILSLRQRSEVSLPELSSSICTRTSNISGGQIAGENIRHALYAEKQAFCITIMSIILITATAIKTATTLSSSENPLLFIRRLCLLFFVNMISSVCVILFKLLRLFLCFSLVKTHTVISVLFCKPPLISRYLTLPSAIGV